MYSLSSFHRPHQMSKTSEATKQRPELVYRSTYPAGTLVFKEGDPGQSAHPIVSGKIEIQVKKGDKTLVVSTLGPGQIFGDYAHVDNSRRSATAIMVTTTEVVDITRSMIQTKLKAADPFLTAWIEVLVDRIRGLNRRLHGDS